MTKDQMRSLLRLLIFAGAALWSAVAIYDYVQETQTIDAATRLQFALLLLMVDLADRRFPW